MVRAIEEFRILETARKIKCFAGRNGQFLGGCFLPLRPGKIEGHKGKKWEIAEIPAKKSQGHRGKIARMAKSIFTERGFNNALWKSPQKTGKTFVRSVSS